MCAYGRWHIACAAYGLRLLPVPLVSYSTILPRRHARRRTARRTPRLRVRVRMRARRKKIQSFQLFVGKFLVPQWRMLHAGCPVRTSWVPQGTPALDEATVVWSVWRSPHPKYLIFEQGRSALAGRWRLCASEHRVGAFEGCRSAHDHFGCAHSCSLPPSPRRGPVDGTDSAPTKSSQARQAGRRGVSDSLKLGLSQRSTT